MRGNPHRSRCGGNWSKKSTGRTPAGVESATGPFVNSESLEKRFQNLARRNRGEYESRAESAKIAEKRWRHFFSAFPAISARDPYSLQPRCETFRIGVECLTMNPRIAASTRAGNGTYRAVSAPPIA